MVISEMVLIASVAQNFLEAWTFHIAIFIHMHAFWLADAKQNGLLEEFSIFEEKKQKLMIEKNGKLSVLFSQRLLSRVYNLEIAEQLSIYYVKTTRKCRLSSLNCFILRRIRRHAAIHLNIEWKRSGRDSCFDEALVECV